ncbi:uncharacterized protein LOC108741356 [Agrilus planipennis]|uniref:Uncharacterized protein LOC108741356 n=1 Tax=Agrilus planipennis TaxID=224129 RepID=A0A1W4X6C4_AGRPL|nr:uncharacterized protein LOC108741356 [Agrilus planipennis]XP_018331656.1 uncharacterized protein LOC108741356 [Agrilus planipennis]XP_018331657.1 uncharacterized protein LOC108741356 [Agrilus planipennis]
MATSKSSALLEGCSLADAIVLASDLQAKLAKVNEFIRLHSIAASPTPMTKDMESSSVAPHTDANQSDPTPANATKVISASAATRLPHRDRRENDGFVKAAKRANERRRQQPSSIDDFRRLSFFLDESKVQFSTNQLQQDCDLHVVIRGVCEDIPTEDTSPN